MFDDLQFSVSADQIACNLSGEFRLRQDIEELRKSNWDIVRGKRPSAFDGALLRMTSHQLSDDRLVVSASRTSFSAYVVTRPSEFQAEYGDAERANPIGLTAIVRTADDQIIVTVRSPTADQNPGALYLVGGYAEPGENDGPLDLFTVIEDDVDFSISRSLAAAHETYRRAQRRELFYAQTLLDELRQHVMQADDWLFNRPPEAAVSFKVRATCKRPGPDGTNGLLLSV